MRRIIAIAAALAICGLAGAVPQAAAAPDQGRHCAVSLDTGVRQCFATSAEAEDVVAASVMVVKLYDDVEFRQGTSDWDTSIYYRATACTATYADTELVVNLGPLEVNRASSVQTFNMCDIKLYDGGSLTGASSVWIDQARNLANIGTGWSNRANSFKLS